MKKTKHEKLSQLPIKTEVVRPLEPERNADVRGGMSPLETRDRTCTCSPCVG